MLFRRSCTRPCRPRPHVTTVLHTKHVCYHGGKFCCLEAANRNLGSRGNRAVWPAAPVTAGHTEPATPHYAHVPVRLKICHNSLSTPSRKAQLLSHQSRGLYLLSQVCTHRVLQPSSRFPGDPTPNKSKDAQLKRRRRLRWQVVIILQKVGAA